jgi:GntP family gluconate:H+ symporter
MPVATANHPPAILLSIAAVAIALLLLLIMRLKVHAFVSLTLVSLATAIATGIGWDKVLPTLMTGFGNTLASVALLVGLGSMIGKLLEVSGGAKVLADSLIQRFGEDRAPFALGVASLLFGFPIFFDAGLIVMVPIIFSVAKNLGGPILRYAMPSAGAFAVMHAFLPPHPGPVAAADALKVNIGMLVIVGLLVAFPTWFVGSYLLSIRTSKRLSVESIGALLSTPIAPDSEIKPPKFGTVLLLLMLPVLLIFMDTGLNTLSVAGVVDKTQPLVMFLRMLGNTPVALLITLLVCLAVFAKDFGKAKLEELCNDALGPICAVILVTGAGGMFGGVLRAGGIGDALAKVLGETGMPVIVAAFVVSACLRIAQGSGTVALTTTSALLAPTVSAAPGLSSLDLCFIVIAIACGSTVLSHFNDSGFWLFSRMFGLDERTTLRTWTAMVTLLGLIGFATVLVLSFIF